MIDDNQLSEVIKDQLKSQGVASFRVKDGQVFIFSLKTLEKLLKAAQEDGRAMVFVKKGAEA